ncbi:hypothetical protein PILCRDRAFT_3751 [Piloderma croceum F 1598]|uniref:Uncharacterized protein n=1 Tax=Piloderma croceum (strain F 1598) TaxID=765440 RepID=A0A0C3GBN9_PILCF|nr:hypothetical protein PILCRDRAFT_3751 [Piloderma croceum F 1598]
MNNEFGIHLDGHYNNNNVRFGARHSQISPVNIVSKCSRVSYITPREQLVKMLRPSQAEAKPSLAALARPTVSESPSCQKRGQSCSFQAKPGQHITSKAAKLAEAKRQIGLETDICELILAKKAWGKESLLRQKELEATLQSTSWSSTTKKALMTCSTTLAQNESILHANSSGKVCTTKGVACTAANPYPIQAQLEARSASHEPLNVTMLGDITGTNSNDGFSVTDIALPKLPAVDVNWDGFMSPTDENFTDFNLTSNYDVTSQLLPSNLDYTPDFNTMLVPTTADGGLWGHNIQSTGDQLQDGAPDILQQFLNNFQ